MATIRKRSGKWQVQIRRANSQPVSRTFHKRTDAEEWSRFMEIQADRHELTPSREAMSQYTVREILIRYQDEVTAKKKGRVQEDRIINFLKKQPLADVSLDVLNESHICVFRDERLETVQPATFVREIAVLQHAFEVAKKEWRYPLKNNPVRGIKKPKVKNSRIRRLEPNEVTKISDSVKTCRNSYIHPIILFALETAMRQSEILNVRWSDINLDRRTLDIPVTKNGHGRTIPLTEKAVSIIEALSCEGSKLLFPTTVSSLRQSWKRLLKRAAIKNLHFHDLRHEAISRFFEMGLSIPEVALISGHKDYRMLFRYTHLKAEDILKKFI